MIIIANTPIEYYNFSNGIVRGYYYAAEFFNGAVYDFWAGKKLNRKQARRAAVLMANGDYNPPIYKAEDIVSVRRKIT